MQYGLREFFRNPEDVKIANLKGGLGGKRVVIQGLGNVGYHAAKFLRQEDDVKIVAIIERDGALLSEQGLSVEKVHAYLYANGGVNGYPDAEYVSDGGKVLEADCDILIPAALEAQITLANAERIKAPLIAEAANGPITFEADEILRKRGIVCIPDAYLNAGGVTVSYFEWIKNLSHIRFGRVERRHEELQGRSVIKLVEQMTGKTAPPELAASVMAGAEEVDLVRSGLDDTMCKAYREVREIFHTRKNVPDLRTAAFVVAIQKIARTYMEMGL